MNTQRPSPEASTRYKAFLVFAAVGLSPWAIDAFGLIAQGLESVLKPFPTCRAELIILDGVRTVAERGLLFPELDRLPFTVHFYNTLNYLPAGLIGRFTDQRFEDLLVASRVLPFLSAFGILVLVGRLVWRQSGSWIVTAFGVAMVLVYHSSALTDFFRNRPETPGILLSLMGWMALRDSGRRSLATAGLLFVLALGFKQTFVAAPLAAGVELLLRGRWRACVELGLVVVGGTALLCAASVWLGGPAYFEHAWLAMASQPMEIVRRSLFFYGVLVADHWGLLVGALAAVLPFAVGEAALRPTVRYLAICALCTTVFHGKVGSDLNYHGELSLLMVILVACSVGCMIRQRSWWIVLPVSLMLVSTWGTTLRDGFGSNEICHNRIAPTPHCYSKEPPIGDMATYVRRYEPLRDEALFLHAELGLRLGRPVLLDWYALDLLFHEGFLDLELLRREVVSGSHRLLIFDATQMNRSALSLLREAKRSGYRVARQDPLVIELVRKERPAGMPAAGPDPAAGSSDPSPARLRPPAASG